MPGGGLPPSGAVPTDLAPHRPAQAPTQQGPSHAGPIVKWAGGKSRLLAQLRPLLPPAVHRRRHLEPFLGGGALFFSEQPTRAVLTDVNESLIGAYLAVRDDLSALLQHLQRLAEQHSQAHYYHVRDRYNQGSMEPTAKAAAFLYLNRTCFNGLHRVNRKGEFNVPFGRYAKPRIVQRDTLQQASRLLQHATVERSNAPAASLQARGFEHVLETANPGDFVYFDPPYVPLSSSSSFTSYAKQGFGPDDQRRLRDVMRALDRRGCCVMLSNSDTPITRELYQGFRIDTVAAPRAISCNVRTRKPVTELVVRNY